MKDDNPGERNQRYCGTVSLLGVHGVRSHRCKEVGTKQQVKAYRTRWAVCEETKSEGGIQSRESTGRTGCVLGRAGSGRVKMGILLWVGRMSFGYTITSGSILLTVRRYKHTQVCSSV